MYRLLRYTQWSILHGSTLFDKMSSVDQGVESALAHGSFTLNGRGHTVVEVEGVIIVGNLRVYMFSICMLNPAAPSQSMK